MPTAITDLPLPVSSSMEAIAAYRAGIQASRDANRPAMRASFKRAGELDPTMAVAHLRYAMVALEDGLAKEAREAFGRAMLLRSSLSPREQGIARVLEPVLWSQSPDFAEALRRGTALADGSPLDAELWDLVAAGEYSIPDLPALARAAHRALDLDPHYADPWLWIAWSTWPEGKVAEEEAAYQSCIRAAPGAYTCLEGLAGLHAVNGRCDQLEADAGRLIQTSPGAASGYAYRASAMALRGEAHDTLRAAVDAWVDASKDTRGGPVRSQDVLDLWEGNFDALLARRAAREADLAPIRDAVVLAGAAHRLVVALEETRQHAEAVKVAEAFLARRPVLDFSTMDGDPIADDSALLFLEAHGRDGWPAKRAEWIAAWAAAAPASDPRSVWASMYAAAAATREDAEGALATSRGDPPQAWGELRDLALGNAYWLAGRVDEAIPFLERVTRSCDVLFRVPERVRARMELAQAYEGKGDRARACASYGWVVRHWGHARPGSVTADKAKERVRTLGCAP